MAGQPTLAMVTVYRRLPWQPGASVAVIVNLRMSIREAWWIFGLFWAQFIASAAAGPELHDEVLLVTSAIYLVIAVWLLVQHRSAARQLVRDGIRAPYEELTPP